MRQAWPRAGSGGRPGGNAVQVIESREMADEPPVHVWMLIGMAISASRRHFGERFSGAGTMGGEDFAMPRRPYPWPSSKIDPALMHRLHLASLDHGVPLTELVRIGAITLLAELEAGHAALEATIAAGCRRGSQDSQAAKDSQGIHESDGATWQPAP